MKVYLVNMTLPYDDSWIEGVFSTREKAQAYIDAQPRDYYWKYYTIDEQEVDRD